MQVGSERIAGHRASWALERNSHPQKWPSKRESQPENKAFAQDIKMLAWSDPGSRSLATCVGTLG